MSNIKLNFSNDILMNGKRGDVTCIATDILPSDVPIHIKTKRTFSEQKVAKMEKLMEVFSGTDGEKGEQGYSAYELWLQNGNTGTYVEYELSLKGKDGINGKDGIDGKDGKDGKDGQDGKDGKDGENGVDGQDGRDGLDGKDGTNGIDGKTLETVVISTDRGRKALASNTITKLGTGHTATAGVEKTFSRGDHIHDVSDISGVSTFLGLTDTPNSYSSQAGKVVLVNGAENALEFGVASSTDEKLKINAGDTTAGYLDGKLLAGTGITLIATSSGDKTMTVASTIYSIMTQLGDIIYGGIAGTPTRLPVGGANEVLHGGSIPAYSAVVEADITLANNTTNNVTVARHGFCPSLSGTTNTFLRGDGSFAAPTASTVPNAYIAETISSDTSKTVTHNFGAFPLVQVLDTATGAVLIPLSIVNNSLDDFTVTLAVTGNYTIIATLGSPQLNAYTTKSDDYTMEAGDYIIRQTVADKTITLLTAVGRAGKIVSIKNSSTGDIHVTGTGGETLEGVTTVDIPAGDCYDFFSNNTNWEAK